MGDYRAIAANFLTVIPAFYPVIPDFHPVILAFNPVIPAKAGIHTFADNIIAARPQRGVLTLG